MSDVFKVGDVVVLKSGSPKMTVSVSNKETTTVRYYEPGLSSISLPISLPTGMLELDQKTETN